jgi:hypothetical protein
VVDSAGNTGREPAVAISPDGAVHIVYVDLTNDRLKHAVFLNNHWSIDIVDQGGREPSIANGPGGKLLVSYYDHIDYNLKFAILAGSGWAVEVIDSPGDVGMFNAIGIGLDNRVRVAYLDATNGDLKYAVRYPLSP